MQQLVTTAPIQIGIQLYHGLLSTFNVLLVTDDTKEKTDYWLRIENLNKHGAVLYGEKTEASRIRRIKQVNTLRSRGYAVDLVIEPDPSIAAELLRNGYNICSFLHSSYAYPTWRPDFEGEERGWEEIEKRVTVDKIMRSEDPRLDPDKTELL